MKSDRPYRHFVIPLMLAVLIYVVAYCGISHLRNRKGPWQIEFTHTSTNAPMLLINQSALGITNVQVTFAPAAQSAFTNSVRLNFVQPKPVPYDLPFGQCIFMDTTFLPGTLTMRVFGHELELLPRVMII